MNPDPSPSTRFQTGNRANPGGRPTGTRSVSARLRELLEQNTVGGKPIEDGKQVADLVAETIICNALKGDYRFVDLLLNRSEGKVPDPEPATFSMKEVQARRMARRAAYRDPDEPKGL